MNLAAPAAVAALEAAFLDMLRSESGGFGAFESEARPVALSCCAEAMSRALEERDRELAASRPAGLRGHSRRRAPSPRCAVTSASAAPCSSTAPASPATRSTRSWTCPPATT